MEMEQIEMEMVWGEMEWRWSAVNSAGKPDGESYMYT